jgi:hypothetical protein
VVAPEAKKDWTNRQSNFSNLFSLQQQQQGARVKGGWNLKKYKKIKINILMGSKLL